MLHSGILRLGAISPLFATKTACPRHAKGGFHTKKRHRNLTITSCSPENGVRMLDARHFHRSEYDLGIGNNEYCEWIEIKNMYVFTPFSLKSLGVHFRK